MMMVLYELDKSPGTTRELYARTDKIGTLEAMQVRLSRLYHAGHINSNRMKPATWSAKEKEVT
jgi:hypothetical protein